MFTSKSPNIPPLVIPIFVLLFMAAAIAFSVSNGTLFSITVMLSDEPLSSEHALPAEFHKPGSCWSRHEKNLFWKKTTRSPNPNFVAAIEAYEVLHARCTSNVTDWKLHLASLSYSNTAYEGCRYLVYRSGTGGLGNRLTALTSAFLYALITDRAMLMPVGTNDMAMFCEPFAKSSWWADLGSIVTHLPIGIQDFFEKSSLNRTLSAVRVNLDYTADVNTAGAFYCDETQSALQAARWIAFQSDTWTAPSFHLSPILRTRLLKVFPDGVHFTPIARYLLSPNNDIWEYIKRMYAAYLQPADLRIGIQIRAFSRSYQEANLQAVLRCAMKGLGLPSPINNATWQNLTSPENRDTIARPVGTLPSRRVAFLLTSLDIAYYKAFQEEYASLPMNDSSTVSAHILSFEGKESHSRDQERKALAEMYLLSFSDELMISRSTFGHIAAGLFGSPSWKLSITGGRKSTTYTYPTCFLASSEPCQFVLFQANCSAGSGTKPAPWPQYTPPCLEWEWGREITVPSQTFDVRVD